MLHPNGKWLDGVFNRHKSSALSPWRLEMESYRTPSVLPDQQELGGPTLEELSDGPQLHSHHYDFDGTEGARSSAAEEIRKR